MTEAARHEAVARTGPAPSHTGGGTAAPSAPGHHPAEQPPARRRTGATAPGPCPETRPDGGLHDGPAAHSGHPGPEPGRGRGPGRVPILMYHSVSANPTPATRSLSVTPAAFARQLAQLAEDGFTTTTISGLLAARQAQPGAGEQARRLVALTFDDGYADAHSTVLPLLRRHGFTATVFVTTGWIRDAGRGVDVGGRLAPMLRWGQIAELHQEGIEIGAHTCTHPQLDQLPTRTLRHELEHSRAVLEDRLGAPVSTLAYPYGYHSARVRDAVREAGYLASCAVRGAVSRPGEDPFALPRLTVRRDTGPELFRRLVTARRLPAAVWRDRAVTAGYLVVRRGRSVWGRVCDQ
ncbi:polysaccharide deacetylase family protein [Allostreptomyces psammosilenae]|uniref:Peptidoglycan/xylan/chitin deacetylase (PgdA/CDA1 family) n=1 Tax=Allostreptomyces psammosilenae TaxID=1892865 RepID=A0A853A173_9ACTN|nr:polysaccharide deacetylase family protein [Allostreptomyces psammosilenae]NYI08119.1 peptidoglycan/xylan/chitin deacetylase (PgdA/CDA1 family) [Allostreptomyces psammosilenae]